MARTPGTAQVDIQPDRLVYHDGDQRTGLIDNVDPDLAMSWLRQRWARWIWIH